MSLSLISAVLLSTAMMNVEVDSLPYLDPSSPWWPSYSYGNRGETRSFGNKEESYC